MSGLELRTLPLILLGPILRRAEQRQVCIWLAFSRPVTVQAEIFRAKDLDASDLQPIGSGTVKSMMIGRYLHIALVIARPAALHANQTFAGTGFPVGELLAYDIKINDESSKTVTLENLGLLGGKHSIVYENSGIPLPTFFLRGKNTALNFLHGSCRKLHGKGEDSLVAADQVISSSLTDLKKRPGVLFLTGDQIYADDVADPLSRYLTEYGIRILGWEERITGIEKKVTEIRPGERQKIVQDYAKFTSDSADNHLLSFGEFAAMYLLTWNAENWPDRFPNSPGENQRKYLEQIQQLEKTRKDLPAVRRALANIPTYMIFDDHDITDDWNITREWRENVRASGCGKQVIANGLAAYWAFQGWGNDPTLYNSDFINKITGFFGKGGKADESEQAVFDNLLWDFNNWAYQAPTSPLTIVTDCRTQRHYDSYDGPPQLIGDNGMQLILEIANNAGYQKGDPVIIVSPTPVFGFLLLEAVQRVAAKLTSVYKLDLETWFANEAGLVNFLSFLLQSLGPKHCVFLSGDVHYGFTIRAAFALLQKNQDLHMSITQLNSSALKTTSLVKIAFVSEIMGRIRQLFPWKQEVRLGWANGNAENNRLSSKSLRIKNWPTRHLHIQPRRKRRIKNEDDNNELKRRSPDWIEARAIVKPSGSVIPPLLISDNNIGLVTMTEGKIIHRFLVRKEITKETMVHETVVAMDGRGRNELEALIEVKLRQFSRQRFSTTLHGAAS